MEILQPLVSIQLLVLDDVGKEKTSEWVEETMTFIVNSRPRLTTIFTSNYEDNPDIEVLDFGCESGPGYAPGCTRCATSSTTVGRTIGLLPPSSGVDDLMALWKVTGEQRRGLPSRAKGQVRAPAEAPRPRRPWLVRGQSWKLKTDVSFTSIPFCSSICNYCNFNRGLFDAGLKARYVGALEREILQAGRGEAVDTVYFGGGTPSLLEPSEIGRLIHACRQAFRVEPGAEITLETNPETSSVQRMDGFREAGVNRVSFGVQSFRDAELKRLGRLHSADRAVAAAGEARTAGFGNISLDLMMPGQSVSDWAESVSRLIETGPDHVSCTCSSCIPTRRSRRTWPAPAGRWRLTRTPPRCIWWAGGARRRRVSAA